MYVTCPNPNGQPLLNGTSWANHRCDCSLSNLYYRLGVLIVDCGFALLGQELQIGTSGTDELSSHFNAISLPQCCILR
jgi:hypothetical protein